MKEPYSLPECDRERLNRDEMRAVRWCFIGGDSFALSKDILRKRLQCIPFGEARWRLIVGQITSVLGDIMGTVPKKQKNAIVRTASDMEVRMVPKLTLRSDAAAINLGDLSFLIRHAKKDICTACILTDDECRSCELYKILESVSPLEDYGDGTICPYMKDDWWDR